MLDLGSSVGICDVNGDGRVDLLVGARLMERANGDGSNNQGAVYVWLGYPDGFLEADQIRYGPLE